ncbi:MAG: RNA-binding S4 domain-containing protein [Desulfamplus sp.]|nr:RNA-binding S4 domain-containing protein [Desulfamplus sp.]
MNTRVETGVAKKELDPGIESRESTETRSEEHRLVIINREPVELCKILKFENVVFSGGEAKTLITNGMVLVNGCVEKRKRKKIFAGDIIEFNGKIMEICKTG